MITCKDSVRFAILRPHIYTIFEKIDGVFRDHSLDCVITCGTDSHPADDVHPHGFAVDLRSKHIPDNVTKHAIHAELQTVLGGLYTVLFENEGTENEHFHIQIRKGLWRQLI